MKTIVASSKIGYRWKEKLYITRETKNTVIAMVGEKSLYVLKCSENLVLR